MNTILFLCHKCNSVQNVYLTNFFKEPSRSLHNGSTVYVENRIFGTKLILELEWNARVQHEMLSCSRAYYIRNETKRYCPPRQPFIGSRHHRYCTHPHCSPIANGMAVVYGTRTTRYLLLLYND